MKKILFITGLLVLTIIFSQVSFAERGHYASPPVEKAYSCYDQFYDWYEGKISFPCGCGKTCDDHYADPTWCNSNYYNQCLIRAGHAESDCPNQLYNWLAGKVDFPCECAAVCKDYVSGLVGSLICLQEQSRCSTNELLSAETPSDSGYDPTVDSDCIIANSKTQCPGNSCNNFME